MGSGKDAAGVVLVDRVRLIVCQPGPGLLLVFAALRSALVWSTLDAVCLFEVWKKQKLTAIMVLGSLGCGK